MASSGEAEGRAIHTIHWNELPVELVSAWVSGTGRVFAIWPAPVDADACFEEAGFRDFRDSDERWGAEFFAMTERIFKALERAGPAKLCAGEKPVRAPGIRAWIREALSGRRDKPSPLDVLVAAASDDRFQPCVVEFGEPVRALLRASDGHPIFWVWAGPGGPDVESALNSVAEGRTLKRTILDWSVLASSSPS